MSSDIFIPLSIVLSHAGQFQFMSALDGSVESAREAAFPQDGADVDWEYAKSLMTPVLMCQIGARATWRVVDIIFTHGLTSSRGLRGEPRMHICCGNSYATWLIHWLEEHGHEYTMADDPRDRDPLKSCYQCGAKVAWLAPDSRCSSCTRLTVEEIRGHE